MRTITKEELDELLAKHEQWINRNVENSDGKLYLYDVDLHGVNLYCKDLRGADIRYCDLSGADLSYSNLTAANLAGTNLTNAVLCGADLYNANLMDCNLEETNLTRANVRHTILNGAKNMQSPINYLKEHFEFTEEGLIAYKVFGHIYSTPSYWKIEKGSVITENCDFNRIDLCGCGIHVATFNWVTHKCKGEVWKVLIRWEWLPGVVVPYDTDGKIRCEKCELVDIVAEVDY